MDYWMPMMLELLTAWNRKLREGQFQKSNNKKPWKIERRKEEEKNNIIIMYLRRTIAFMSENKFLSNFFGFFFLYLFWARNIFLRMKSIQWEMEERISMHDKWVIRMTHIWLDGNNHKNWSVPHFDSKSECQLNLNSIQIVRSKFVSHFIFAIILPFGMCVGLITSMNSDKMKKK